MQTSHTTAASRAAVRRPRVVGALAAVVVGSAVVTGCGGDDTATPPESGAASLASAASSAASKLKEGSDSAASAMASASASVASEMAKIRGGLDAKADVKAGSLKTDAEGRTTAPLTVTNSTSESHDYTVQVNFKDAEGNALDMVVVSVKDIDAGASRQATARSTYPLNGVSAAEVANALRY